MSKFEIITMTAYWVGCFIWIYGAYKTRQVRKKLEEAMQMLIDSERELRERFESGGTELWEIRKEFNDDTQV